MAIAPNAGQRPELNARHHKADYVNFAEYDEWWRSVQVDSLDEPARTLATHVLALQERLRLSGDHCACAYDHPDDVCMVHKDPTR